ncbi:RNA-directed DNA polymerase from mobile element jockey [Plakobranchus ocellatus]|uniref:RNA-directed DNA polymerase from mobile element jockey n=1 Tax=Plakobranchus ocellatus TaxID=259542 RepID=A0AAV4ADK8_9GAST|nr:RNA-directed DNA polymerase from mobile element jockey [Plakobranchus ocellatus]
MAELKNSIVESNESVAGPDGMYYQFLRHLSESCLHTLLKLFYNIWTTGESPQLGGRLRWFQFQNPGRILLTLPTIGLLCSRTACVFGFEDHLCPFPQTKNSHSAHPSSGRPADPVKGEAKLLGVVFDSKLNFSSHVKYLKKKCLKALNLLRVVGLTDWAADRAILLKLYRTLVWSKLDYGSVVYGSAKKHVLRALDPIHHQGLRIALGAFRTSPIKSLYAEAGEPSLEHRRIKLTFNYVLKLKSLSRNPCHDVVSEAPLSNFSADLKSERNLVASTFEHIKNAKINLKTIDILHVQCPPLGRSTRLTWMSL